MLASRSQRDSMPNHKEYEKLMKGRVAGALLDQLQPYLDVRERNILMLLKSEYLSGRYSEVSMAAHIAALCEIDKLRIDLSNDVKRMQHIQRETPNE